MHFHVSAPPSQCCTIAASRSFHIASTSGERARISGSLVEQRREAVAAAGLVHDLGPGRLDEPRVDVVHGVGILESLRRVARVLDDHDHRRRWRQRGPARAVRARSHRSSETGPEPPPDDPPLELESSSTRARMAKAPAIKSKATANATRRRAIAGRVCAGRDSAVAARLRLRDARSGRW